MAGLLESDFICNTFGSVLSSIYGDGKLIRVVTGRGAGGVVTHTEQAAVDIKFQIDVCTEAMRQQEGYTDKDVAMFVLQMGVTGGDLTSDDIIEARGKRWKMYGITTDPAKSYWLGRAVLEG